MPKIFRDIETCSAARLGSKGVPAWRYATDPTTRVHCVAFAVDDGPTRIWIPGQPVPPEYSEAARNPDWWVVAHNDEFETAIETHVLHSRYDWPLVPIERHICTMAAARANALPGALEKAAAALQLRHQKDAEGRKVMLRQSKPQPAREDDAKRLEQLYAYCRKDVEVERAVHHRLIADHDPLLLSPAEQAYWVMDARINARGFGIDVALAQAALKLTRAEQRRIDTEVGALTNGEITSVNQVERLAAFLRKRGHKVKGVGKRSVSTVLAHNPDNDVRQLLELRRAGARASVRKLDTLLNCVDPDGRLRGCFNFHAASTGRWSGSHFQPQNLKKPESKDLDAAIAAVLASDMERIRELGNPLSVIGDISRSMIRASPGHVFFGGDFGAIESRVLAWLAGENWKLENYREFDCTGDPKLEPYCVTASRMLGREVTPNDEAGRGIGKTADLALGFGGAVSAWRRFAPDDARSDAEIQSDVTKWRRAHPNTRRFWKRLENAVQHSVRNGQLVAVGNLACEQLAGNLYLTLPGGRRLAYPEARLGPGKFDDTTQVHFKDNSKGAWREARGWHGTWCENAVQAISRDLLAAALQRLEAAGYPIVLHCHDEVICEVPEGFGSCEEFLGLMRELPDWASGLPIAAKVWAGTRYAKTKVATDDVQPKEFTAAASITPDPQPAAPLGINGAKVHAAATEAPIELPQDPAEEKTIPSLADLIDEPLVNGKICCPFHEDSTPSLHIYGDHFHCFGCGAHGDAIDWLMMVEGLDRDVAIELLGNWQAPSSQPRRNEHNALTFANAIRLWELAQPIAGTPAIQYLADVRKIDTGALPTGIGEALRFHPRCPFGPGTRYPCLLALMRDGLADAPIGIQRIALTPEVLAGGKVERRMLGRAGTVKLWPAASTLVIGEGIETVLAAATRIPYRGAPLQPAWSTLTTGKLSTFPVLPGVERLIILVDHDINGAGQLAATVCTERWSRAGRIVVRLTPEHPGADFNDLVMPE